MSDSDSPSGQRHGASGATAQRPSARQGWNPGLLLRALWSRVEHILSGASAESSSSPTPRGTGNRMWLLILSGLLLCLPIAGMVLGYFKRPPAGTASIAVDGASTQATSDNAGKIPKPAAGRPMGSGSQAPLPSVTSPTPTPIAPLSPSQVAPPQNPIPPMGTPTPQSPTAVPPPSLTPPASGPFAAVTYPARHDKHFGGECAGQLTLNSSELVFSCPADPGSGFQVALNQIDAVDDNGIRLASGKKYHFTIPGMDKGAERALFADWLSRVR